MHKWYFQKDICDLTLFNLNVVAADLRFPFCSPQTDNVCITFQVLAAEYNNFLSITEPAASDSAAETFIDNFLKTAIPDTPERHTNILNTFRTEGCMSHPQLKKYMPNLAQLNAADYFHSPDGLWGDPIYIYKSYGSGTTAVTAQTPSQVRDKIKSNMNS